MRNWESIKIFIREFSEKLIWNEKTETSINRIFGEPETTLRLCSQSSQIM